MTGDSSGKTHSGPLLGEEDAKHGHVGTSEIPRISWRRAIGVFHLYMAWLIAELVGLAVALTALVTDHWIVPTGSALPFVKHAGLWKVCFASAATESEGRAVSDVATFAEIKKWWATVEDSFLEVGDEQDTQLTFGCTRNVAELYAHMWSNDFVVWLQIIRAFCVLFLWVGFLKILVVSRTYLVTTKGRWLSSAFAIFLAMLQISFGEVAWFLVLSMIQIAMRDAPGFLDRGTFASYEGWSFWAFFAATQWCFLVTSLYLFVEGMAGCTEQRRRRFGVFGTRGAHVVGDGKVSPNKPRTSHDGRRSSAGTSGGGAVAHEDGGKMPVG